METPTEPEPPAMSPAERQAVIDALVLAFRDLCVARIVAYDAAQAKQPKEAAA